MKIEDYIIWHEPKEENFSTFLDLFLDEANESCYFSAPQEHEMLPIIAEKIWTEICKIYTLCVKLNLQFEIGALFRFSISNNCYAFNYFNKEVPSCFISETPRFKKKPLKSEFYDSVILSSRTNMNDAILQYIKEMDVK